MIHPIREGLFLFLACWLLAKLEIHIEGEHGWAEKLPTWRVASPLVLRLTNGKPLTGYHVYMNAFLLCMLHLPLLFVEPSRPVEGRILSFYFLMTVFWDFQWFVWNPAWGVRRFFRERVWWEPVRLAGVPVEYYLGCGASLAACAALAPGELAAWGVRFMVLAAATLVSAAASLAYFEGRR